MRLCILAVGVASCWLTNDTVGCVPWIPWVMEKGHTESDIVNQFRENLRGLRITSVSWESYYSVQLISRVLESVMETIKLPLWRQDY